MFRWLRSPFLPLAATLLVAGCGDKISDESLDPGATEEASVTVSAPEPTPVTAPTTTVDRPKASDEMIMTASVLQSGGHRQGVLRVRIGDSMCAEDEGYTPIDGDGPLYILHIPSAQKQVGCGTPGAVMHFMLDETPLPITVFWQSGTFGHVSFRLGSPYQTLYGDFSFSAPGWPHWIKVEPRIGGTVCGFDRNPFAHTVKDQYMYSVVVLSADEQPGCGGDGAEVELWAMQVIRSEDGQQEELRQIGLLTTVPWKPDEFQAPYEPMPDLALVGDLPASPTPDPFSE